MDNHRNTYVSQVRNDLAMLISAQKREEETLRNIKNMKFSPEILQKKQSDMKASITKRAESIFILEQREQDFISGKLDNEIKQEIKKNTDNFNSRLNIAMKKKKDVEKEEEEKKVKMTAHKQQSYERNPSKDHAYYYKVFLKARETFPNYMKENLTEMPNNKGYIWRDCWFVGDKPEEPGQPTVMFDKKRGGVMHIHEIDIHEHRIFEKVGKDKKKLISRVPRKIKSISKINTLVRRR